MGSLECRNLTLLALCWACSLSSSTLLTAVGPLAAQALGASTAHAPFAVAAFLCGAALISIPSAPLFSRFGRQVGFLVGCAFNVVAGIIGILGCTTDTLAFIFAACFLSGLSQGLAQFYRFAAMEVCAPTRKPFAVTLVLSGGVIAAFAGPNLANATKGIRFGSDEASSGVSDPHPERLNYLGSFIVVGILGVLNAILSSAVRFAPAATVQPKSTDTRQQPLLRAEDAGGEVRHRSGPPSPSITPLMSAAPPPVPLLDLMTAPRCIAAICAATIAHSSMVMLMSPLAIVMHTGVTMPALPVRGSVRWRPGSWRLLTPVSPLAAGCHYNGTSPMLQTPLQIGDCWNSQITTIAMETHFACMFGPGFFTGEAAEGPVGW